MSVPVTVQTQVWTPNPERPGYLRLERTRTVREVYDDLRAIVGEYPYGGEEYFSVSPITAGLLPWPEGRIVVFAVNGSSEGDYVHVEVQDVAYAGKRTQLMLAKTLDSRDAAWAFARRLADLLEA